MLYCNTIFIRATMQRTIEVCTDHRYLHGLQNMHVPDVLWYRQPEQVSSPEVALTTNSVSLGT